MKKKVVHIRSSNQTDQLYVAFWMPDSEKCRGVIQISHGMIEHIERYEAFAKSMTKYGFAVVGNDHLGHGRTAETEENLGYMQAKNSSRVMVQDLHHVSLLAKKKYPDVPFILLGHSMGSFLARRYAMTYGKELDALIIMGTGFQPKPVLMAGLGILKLLEIWKGPRFRSLFAQLCAFGAYNDRIAKPCQNHAWISSRKEEVEKYEADPLCSYLFTIKGYQTLLKTLWYIEDEQHMQKLPRELPMLFLSGSDDPVGNYTAGVKKVARQYRSLGILEQKVIFYPGARHEILNDYCSEQVKKDMLDWLYAHLYR